MVDYNKSTGTTGTMIIRDNGSTITFIISNSGSQTFVYGASWSGRVNGTNVGGTYDRVGVGSTTLGSWTVSSNQTVEFNIAATGTSGLGGPTSHSAYISRATVPAAPTPLECTPLTHTTIRYRFRGNSNGGSSILEWQVGYGTNSSTPQSFVSSNGTSDVGGLAKDTVYHFWSRGRNAIGWGPWSSRLSARTLKEPSAPTNVGLTGITHQNMTYEFDDGPNGGMAITSREYQYSPDPSFAGAVATSAPATGIVTRTDLIPGVRYHWRSRAINAAGAGPWSAAISATTIAGVKVRNGGVYKNAIPFVRVAGVWKPAEPYVRNVGVWKKLTH